MCDDAYSLLTACSNLRSLSVRSSPLFSNHALDYIYQLTTLRHLDLRDVINVVFPTSAALAENLETLAIRDCVGFKANFPLLGAYTNLRSLYMDSAPCEQLYCLKFTTNMVNLESLVLTPWVSKNEQPPLRIAYLTRLKNLTRLDLQCNAVIDWESISQMTQLQSLAVSSNFAQEEADHFSNLPRLSSLSICYNDNIDDCIADRLEPLKDQLVDLDLQGCPMITSASVDMIQSFSRLKRLNLKETAVALMDITEVPNGVILSEVPEDMVNQ